MDMQLKATFETKWAQYFPGQDLPIAFFYTADANAGEPVPPPKGHRCMVALLAKVFRGTALLFDKDALGCDGARRYYGYLQEMSPSFPQFLSAGIPGKLEGERYKKTPELVIAYAEEAGVFEAPAPYVCFKRWDMLEAGDEPAVVVFLAPPDVLSGLFTLAAFDESAVESTIAPFGAGCGTIGQYPYQEGQGERPRAVLGMFDVSARPCVRPEHLSFAVPMAKFARMVHNMDESFLITPSWERVRNRLAGGGEGAS